ncbi:phosphoglucomutase [Gottschalkiaceae bacterium SANA]|nr:phosphoglucomutase [Gottschalkiaceae bacterium SANA]
MSEFMHLQNGTDIRGVAIAGVEGEPISITPAHGQQIGAAFARWLKQNANEEKPLTIAIGRDSRISGPDLVTGTVQGLRTEGCRVLNCGLASTPAMFMSTVYPEIQADGAIMITASHLPYNRNGLKFFSPKGGLEKADIQWILEKAETIKLESQEGSEETSNLMDLYSASLVSIIQERTGETQPLLGKHIVLDAGNGAGGFFAEKVLAPLGADTRGSQFLDPDGMFPNHVPNPEDEAAMKAIEDCVKENNADLGIIFDTDVDRAAVVSSDGRSINRNRLIALIGSICLKETPGATLVTDSVTSDGLAEFIYANGGHHHRFKRGYKNVINEAIRLNAIGQDCPLAIETSGHAALKENHFLDDGAYLVVKLLIEMAERAKEGKDLAQAIETLKIPKESKEYRIKINAEDFKTYGQDVIEDLEGFAKGKKTWSLVPDNYEGVRIAFEENGKTGWFLVRLSLHDPVMPVNIESNESGGVSQTADALIEFLNNFKQLDLSAF